MRPKQINDCHVSGWDHHVRQKYQKIVTCKNLDQVKNLSIDMLLQNLNFRNHEKWWKITSN